MLERPNMAEHGAYPAVIGSLAIVPPATAKAMANALKMTHSDVWELLGNLPRLNLSNSRDRGNNIITINHTRVNIFDTMSKLAPALAYSTAQRHMYTNIDVCAEPVRGMVFRSICGITRSYASCCSNSQALKRPRNSQIMQQIGARYSLTRKARAT